MRATRATQPEPTLRPDNIDAHVDWPAVAGIVAVIFAVACLLYLATALMR